MEANRVGAMPILYRLADPRRREYRPTNLRKLAVVLAAALALSLVLRRLRKRSGR
jgi:hypothetical protein